MKHWYKYVVVSLGLHAILVAVLLLFSGKPAKVAPPAKTEPIKSYLVVSPEALVSMVKATIEEKETAGAEETAEVEETLISESIEDKALQEPDTESESNTDDEIKSLDSPEFVAEEVASPTEGEAAEEQTSSPTVTSQSISKAVKNYLNAGNTTTTSWQQKQQEQFTQRFRNRRSTETTDLTGEKPFAHKGTGIDHIATSADGSQLIKHQGVCYSVGPDQWGDSLWTPTPCPNSANKNSKLLQQSLRKYGLLKNK